MEIGNSPNYAADGLVHINEITSAETTGKKWDAATTIDP